MLLILDNLPTRRLGVDQYRLFINYAAIGVMVWCEQRKWCTPELAPVGLASPRIKISVTRLGVAGHYFDTQKRRRALLAPCFEQREPLNVLRTVQYSARSQSTRRRSSHTIITLNGSVGQRGSCQVITVRLEIGDANNFHLRNHSDATRRGGHLGRISVTA